MENNNALNSKQSGEECEESIKGPSFTLMYILLVALFCFIFISLHSLNQLSQIEKEKANQITEIKNALANLETLPEHLYTAEGEKKSLSVTIEYPKILVNEDDYLGTIIPIIQEQNAQAYDKLSSNVTLFSVIIALFTLALPVFSYAFIQKDQLRTIDAQHYRLKKDALQRFKELENKNIALETSLKKAVDDAIELLRKEINQAQEVTSNVIPDLKGNDAVEITPTDESPAATARAYYLGAKINLVKERYYEASKQIEQAIKIEPNNAEYLYIKSVVLWRMLDFPKALLAIDRAIDLYPNNALYYQNRASSLLRLKRYKECQLAIEKALSLAPDEKEYRANLSYIQYRRGLYDDALNECRQLGEEAETLYLTLRTRALASLKKAVIEAGSISEELRTQTLNDLERALKIIPNNTYSYIDQAQACYLIGEYTSMFESLEKARSLNADEPETYHWLAEYYRAIGDAENAALNDRLADEKGYIPEPEE